jgi:hypothetical protein
MLIIRLEFIEQSLSQTSLKVGWWTSLLLSVSNQTPGTLKFHHSSRTLVDYFYFDFSEDPVCPSIELER